MAADCWFMCLSASHLFFMRLLPLVQVQTHAKTEKDNDKTFRTGNYTHDAILIHVKMRSISWTLLLVRLLASALRRSHTTRLRSRLRLCSSLRRRSGLCFGARTQYLVKIFVRKTSDLFFQALAAPFGIANLPRFGFTAGAKLALLLFEGQNFSFMVGAGVIEGAASPMVAPPEPDTASTAAVAAGRSAPSALATPPSASSTRTRSRCSSSPRAGLGLA